MRVTIYYYDSSLLHYNPIIMKYKLTYFLFFFTLMILSQEKKSLHIQRVDNPPKIDGILDDQAWLNAEEANNFTQFRPEMGVAELDHQKTVVKMAYDDNAIYVSAYLYDKPENIMSQFTSRDNFGQSDFFIVVFNPNNDGLNDTELFVFSSGTQADAISLAGMSEDFGWSAVWDSAVKIVDDGWIVEMKVPYSVLRFSNLDIQTWGIQFHRRFRSDNSQYSWNPIDRTKGNFSLYHGELLGIQNITPPTRLSFYPFASTVTKSYKGDSSFDYNLGLDLKYGITENFTLDATLIPDFSQTGFDDIQLNLGPFEQQFSEQRQFFKEGVDLFSKGNLFYSRRIGGSPSSYPEIDDTNEVITEIPEEVKLLNSVKISGRSKNGLGIGFFNAITERTKATIQDLNTGEYRKEIVEPFANYNILVVDKQFNKNSAISLINTSVLRDGHFRDANVTAALFDLTDKNNKWNVEGGLKVSSLSLPDETKTGFSSNLEFRKVYGKYRFGIEHKIADRNYDINDMGILFRNNYHNISANASYRIFEPTEKLNSFMINAWANYRMLFDPNKYTGNEIGLAFFAENKKLWSYGGNVEFEIGKQHDYYEPRQEGRYFTFKNGFKVNGFLNTNYAKRLAVNLNSGMVTLFDPTRDVFFYWVGFSPRMRFNDNFFIDYSFSFQNGGGGRGFVANIDDKIIFGERNQKSVVNNITGSYNFNSMHSLSLTFRHYWATVTYDTNLFTLLEDGTLSTADNYTVSDINDPNVNFNTWNLDLGYSWQFAPGSQLTALYRNSLFDYNSKSKRSYVDSMNELFKTPIEHIFSLRLVYYIDFNDISKYLKKTSI